MPKGTIVLIPFPFTDLSGSKVRPALILHSHQNGEDCVVSFISSLEQRKVGNYEVEAVPSTYNGLKVSSVIKLNKIATLQKRAVIGELGELEPVIMSLVEKTLKKVFQIK